MRDRVRPLLVGPEHGRYRSIVIEARIAAMRTYTAVVERDPTTGAYVGHIPGWPGAHTQGETLDELHQNLQEVIDLLLEDGEPRLETQFIGTTTVQVA
jgi:predicted RNase H-like HicB family nuclease